MTALIVAAVLLTLGVGGYLAAPWWLGRGGWRLRRPQLCLTLWFASFGAGLISVIAAVVIVIGVGAEAAGPVAVSTDTGAAPPAMTMVAWGALAVVGGVVSLIATQLGSMIISERRVRRDFARLTASSACRRRELAGVEVWVLRSAEPTVLGLRGRDNGILLSTRVVAAVTPGELQAVIEHERAHLRGWHDLASRLAVLQVACLPGRATSEAMARSTALLIELAADRAAARRTDARVTAAALERLAELSPDSVTAETLRLRAALVAA